MFEISLVSRPFYRLGLVTVEPHPVVDLGTDVVHGLLVSNTGHDEMDVFHDHSDALLIFPLLPVLVIGTVLLVKLRGIWQSLSVLYPGRFSTCWH